MTGADELSGSRIIGDRAAQVGAAPVNPQESAILQPDQVKSTGFDRGDATRRELVISPKIELSPKLPLGGAR